jgi:hypothetical protein
VRTILIRMAAAGAAAGAAVGARKATEAGWRAFRHEEPPTGNPFAQDRDLRDVVIWTVTVAGSVYLAKRLASAATERMLTPAPVDAT